MMAMVVVLKILVKLCMVMMLIETILMFSLALRVVQRHTLDFTGTAGMTFSQVSLISHFTQFIPITLLGL